MKKLTFLSLFFFLTTFCLAQTDSVVTDTTKVKSNPIIFLDAAFGVARGLMVDVDLNYQSGNKLFTARWVGTIDADFRIYLFTPNQRKNTATTNEIALLYGYRFVKTGYSFSFSAGVSYNNYHVKDENLEIRLVDEQHIGLPFELTLKLFNNVKQRYRVFYGLIPIGKRTAFGRGIGLKILGNLSDRSYVGVGLSLGVGYYKHY